MIIADQFIALFFEFEILTVIFQMDPPPMKKRKLFVRRRQINIRIRHAVEAGGNCLFKKFIVIFDQLTILLIFHIVFYISNKLLVDHFYSYIIVFFTRLNDKRSRRHPPAKFSTRRPTGCCCGMLSWCSGWVVYERIRFKYWLCLSAMRCSSR